MRRWMVLFRLLWTALTRRTIPMLAVGTRAPAFRVKDHLGRAVSLSDFSGKQVVLWFFPKADTPG